MSVADLLNHPEFQKLSIADQHDYLKKNSEVFNNYSPKDQGTILFNAKSQHMTSQGHPDYGTTENPKNSPAEDQGFIPKVLSNIGGALMAPIEAGSDLLQGKAPQVLQDATKARLNLREKAKDPSLGPVTRAAYNVGSYIPFIGPQAAQAGEELGAGKYGEGSADALMALLPSVMGALPEGSIANRTVGAYEGFKEAPITHPFLKMAIGETGGKYLGLPHGVGGGVGLLSDKIVGGVKGFFKGPKELEEPITEIFKPNPNISSKLKVGKSSGDNLSDTIGNKSYKVNRPGVRSDLPEIESDFPDPGEGFSVKSPIKTKLKVDKSSGNVGDSPKVFKVKNPKTKPSERWDNETNVEENQPEEERVEGAKKEEAKTTQNDKEKPGHESFLETEAPYKPPITEHEKSEAQSTSREAKETKLAQHLIDKGHNLNNIPRTSDFLKAASNEAGLKWEASLRTLEGAIKKAKMMKKINED
jgi:hypothetical protein